MKANIILCCDGRQNKDFVFCSGVKNDILDLEKIFPQDKYIYLIKYLDSVVKIFDRKCFTTSVITNALYKFYELGVISDNMYKDISDFIKIHARCGLILYAQPKD